MAVLIEETGTVTRSELEIFPLEDLNPYDDTDDGGKHLTHVVHGSMNPHIWEEGMSTQEVIDIARFTIQEIVALCGYRWVPKRNPDKYDVCQKCLKLANEMMGAIG